MSWSWSCIPSFGAVPRDPAERRAKALELAGKGWSGNRIAAALNVSRTTVVSLLRAAREPEPDDATADSAVATAEPAPVTDNEAAPPKTHEEFRSPHLPFWDDTRDQRLLALIDQGCSLTQAAEALGCSLTATRRRMRVLRPDWQAPRQRRQHTAEGQDAVPGHRAAKWTAVVKLDDGQEVVRGVEALPPGHPVSWQALVKGTCLEGSPYTIGSQ